MSAASRKPASIVIFPKCSVAYVLDVLVGILHHMLVAMLYGTHWFTDFRWILCLPPPKDVQLASAKPMTAGDQLVVKAEGWVPWVYVYNQFFALLQPSLE